ncbi:DNA polymerase [Pseudomonas syringae pv. actinidiae]|nr:DNA polymerase [Pseudomonas syringae pv. actinidiae]
MKRLIIDADSIFDQHILGNLHADSSTQRVLSRFLQWLDATTARVGADEVIITSQGLNALETSQNSMESTYGQILRLWGQKNQVKLFESSSRRVLDAINGLSRFHTSVIISADVRVAQLLSETVSMLKPEAPAEYTHRKLAEDMGGLTPQDLPVLLSLVGAPDGNIKAIAGMSRSLELVLRSDKTVENIIMLAKQSTGFDFQQITSNEKQIKLNLQASYSRPLKIAEENLSILQDPLAKTKLDALLIKAPQSPRASQLPDYPVTIKVIGSEEEFAWAKDILMKAPAYSLNFERDGTGIFAATISLKDGYCLYIPFDSYNGQREPKQVAIDFIKETLASKRNMICFSAKDMAVDLYDLKISDYEIKADCAASAYLLDSTVSLDDASELLKGGQIALPKMDDFCSKEGHGLAQNVGIERSSRLAAIRSDLIWKTSKQLFTKIVDKDLKNQYQAYEIPQSIICAKMGRSGLRIDIDKVKATKANALKRLEDIVEKIKSLTGIEVNVTSASDLNKLFDSVNVDTGKTATKQRALNDEKLQAARHKHPVVDLVIQGREASQIIKNGADKLLRFTDSSGILRFNPFTNSTDTGRISIRDPDLQNSTAEMRGAMVAKDGYSMACYDYSQMELRILAHLSQEPKLIKAFAEGKDVHIETAAEVFGVSPSQVTDSQRTAAKSINFGLIYGMSPAGLARKINVSFREAQNYIETYFEKMPKVREFQERLVKEVQESEVLILENRREMGFGDINSQDTATRDAAKRKLMNAPMQAHSAEIVKRALIMCNQKLREANIDGLIVLQVHDELVFEIKTEQLKKADGIIMNAMQTAYPLTVPLIIEGSFGRSLNKKLNKGNELITHYPLTI